MLNSYFSEKGLGQVSLLNFAYDFQDKCFSFYILLIDQVSLPDCFYFLRYWTICLLLLFETNLTFLIKPIHDQKLKTKT